MYVDGKIQMGKWSFPTPFSRFHGQLTPQQRHAIVESLPGETQQATLIGGFLEESNRERSENVVSPRMNHPRYHYICSVCIVI